MVLETDSEEEASSFFPTGGRGDGGGDGVEERGPGATSMDILAGEVSEGSTEEHFVERRAASSAPKPFFKSPKWTNPEAYLASTNSTAEIMRATSAQGLRRLARPPRFPLSRLVLWDRTAFGDVVDISPTDFVPRVHLSEGVVEDVLDEVRRGADSFVLEGALEGSSGVEQKLVLESEGEVSGKERKGEPKNFASVSGASKSVSVELVCYNSEDDMSEVKLPEEMHSSLMERLRERLDSLQGFGPGALLPTLCRCCTTKGSKSSELMLRGSLLLPSPHLKLRPIYPLLTRDTTLSQSLFSVLRRENARSYMHQKAVSSERTGFMTMDQGHRLLPLLENEPLSKEMPLVGVWVTCGPSGVRSALVYSACLRFMYSSPKVVVERTLQNGHFLLLLFSHGSGSPQCFECSFSPSEDVDAGKKQYADLPECLEYSFDWKVYSGDITSKSIQFSACESTKRAPSSGTGTSPAFVTEADEIPEEPRPSAPTPSKVMNRPVTETPAGEEEKQFERWANLQTFGITTDDSGGDGLGLGSDVAQAPSGTGERAPGPPEPTIGAGYWTPFPAAMGGGGVNSKLQESAASALISQQQQQLSMLQNQMRELEKQLKSHVAVSAAAGASEESQATKSVEEQGNEEVNGTPVANPSTQTVEEGVEASLRQARGAGDTMEEDEPVAESKPESERATEGAVTEDLPGAEKALAEGEAGRDDGDASSTSEDDIVMLVEEHVTSRGGNPVAPLPDTRASPEHSFPKVRYIPLSDEESESEEELRILSKYVSLEAYKTH